MSFDKDMSFRDSHRGLHHVSLPSLSQDQGILFLGDMHFGLKSISYREEASLVSWIEGLSSCLGALVLTGDVMDFWIEKKGRYPSYGVLFRRCIQRLCRNRVRVLYVLGNHDAWCGRYWQEEIGAELFRDILVLRVGKKRIFVSHGDKLSVRNAFTYWFKYNILESTFSRGVLSFFPLCWSLAIMNFFFQTLLPRFQRKRRPPLSHDILFKEVKKMVMSADRGLGCDYYIMAHTHYAFSHTIVHGQFQAKYINTGACIKEGSYGWFDGFGGLSLRYRGEKGGSMAFASSSRGF